ncbi:MAG TPA: GNAT family N-acetyltransferase [Galbitalea sp.]|jgi:GNAT superfamily N-acetyltransferase|nr:GNAT family N-acetyltransferase [Galbitalea sp.]
MSEFIVSEMALPAEVGAEGWSDFVAMAAIRNDVQAEVLGSHEWGFEPEELLPPWLDPVNPKRLFVAHVDGGMVGRATYEFSIDDTVAWIAVEVLPPFRGRGIGTALYGYVFDLATAEGKTIFQTDFYSRNDEPGARIASPSGFGSVDAESVSSRFAQARGYQLEMVLRFSRLPLPASKRVLDEFRREAQAKAGADYRIVRWEGRTPERWLDDAAELRGRMYTDAPHGNLDMGDEVWNANRVRALDEIDAQSPRALLVSAVEHIPSNRLVAFTELMVPSEVDRPVIQRDSLVLKEHRGHRLGMLLKIDNIEAVTATRPGHPSINTTNAEENSFMLAVNESVGFTPVAYAGVWKFVPADTGDRSVNPGS